MNKNDIIDRIGYFRVKNKISQKALSIDSGVNSGYINRLESKRDFLPSVEILLTIIDNLGISAEEFFYGDMYSYPQDKAILEKIKTLSPDKKEALLKFL